mmetsp:Transcript_66989/g.178655  ORF Transcript_66989/g.178655 Transcript_66989/m.178655 type:complete len:340 (+) Transcript_66989:55-1074(+)
MGEETDVDWTALRSRLLRRWPNAKVLKVMDEYRRFLMLRIALGDYFDSQMVPSPLVREAWEAHVLDTASYAIDCEILAGNLLHMNPDRVPSCEHCSCTALAYHARFQEAMPADVWPAALGFVVQLGVDEPRLCDEPEESDVPSVSAELRTSVVGKAVDKVELQQEVHQLSTVRQELRQEVRTLEQMYSALNGETHLHSGGLKPADSRVEYSPQLQRNNPCRPASAPGMARGRHVPMVDSLRQAVLDQRPMSAREPRGAAKRPGSGDRSGRGCGQQRQGPVLCQGARRKVRRERSVRVLYVGAPPPVQFARSSQAQKKPGRPLPVELRKSPYAGPLCKVE